jgi:hypothetical protein
MVLLLSRIEKGENCNHLQLMGKQQEIAKNVHVSLLDIEKIIQKEIDDEGQIIHFGIFIL